MKNEKGITILALVISIIVLLIIASISIGAGKQIINEATVQTIETNMLAIKAKAKTYAEEIEAKTWALENEEKDTAKESEYLDKHMALIGKGENYNACVSSIKSELNYNDNEETLIHQWGEQLTEVLKENKIEIYVVTVMALEDMGLDDIENVKDEDYIVIYGAEDFNNIDIIYTPGFSYKGNTIYTLSALQGAHN